MSFELYIPEEYPEKNPLTGQFNKGHTPFNTGKKWEEYMDGRTARKLRRKLAENRYKGPLPDTSRKVVAIKDGKLYGIFKSITFAAGHVGINPSNITHCCRGRQRSAAGYRWFYEDDDKWINLIKDEDEKTK